LGSISQVISGLTVGHLYELTFMMGINNDNTTGEMAGTKRMPGKHAGFEFDADRAAGCAVRVAEYFGERDFGHGAVYRGQHDQHEGGDALLLQTVDFLAPTTSMTLSFSALMETGLSASHNPGNSYCGPVIDKLDLEDTSGGTIHTVTPEPAGLALLGAGMLVVLASRRRVQPVSCAGGASARFLVDFIEVWRKLCGRSVVFGSLWGGCFSGLSRGGDGI